VESTRALLSSPPLALAAFALSSAALLGERLLVAVARGADPETVFAPLLFWIAVLVAFGAFWLVNALRLAGILASPPNPLTTLGAFATAALGAILAPVDLEGLAADLLVLGLSTACFATFFLLHVVLAHARLESSR
jgi:hypothetical protein